MPLSFTPIGTAGKWRGSTWTVEDEDELANMLARVALGQAAIVEEILEDTGCKAPRHSAVAGIQGARNLLSVEGESPAHRDGWIFQVISWIALHLQANATSERILIRPPQMIHAEKGQDGLVVEYSDRDIARIVICEDKATKNPRKQFQSKVLSDFDVYETGARDNVLTAGVIAILGHHRVENADAVVEGILWDEQRAYRVAVTVSTRDASASAQTRLFRGYSKSVRGDVLRRRAEIMPLTDLRPWMNTLANKALAAIDKLDV